MSGSTGPSGYDPLGSYRSPEQREAEELETRSRNKRIGLFSVGAVVLLVASMLINPPTGSVHNFTEASDYKSERESGCVNSGKGCHGSESAYTDFNAYHPNAKCTTCHEYQGFGCIPCHSPAEHECATCHDGTMEAAPDRVRITDPYPRGHYRESTHTAMGTDFKLEVRTTRSGKAKAPCKQCHKRDLNGSHQKVKPAAKSTYGDSVGCGECHNDQRIGSLAQVEAKWKGRRCEDCHAEKSKVPMHSAKFASSIEPSSTGPGCSGTGRGCHAGANLHAMHADKPKDCSGSAEKGEPGCHDLELEANVPTMTACGGSANDVCHLEYENDKLSHKRDGRTHAPSSRTAAADTSFFDTACGDCHFMAADGRSLFDEHGLSTSSKPSGGTCIGCHNDPASVATIKDKWPEKGSTGACEACHGSNGLAAPHVNDLVALHKATGSSGCADTGAGCHPGADLSEVGSSTAGGLHETCLRCHDRTASGANLAYNPSAKSCGSGRACHDAGRDYDPTTAVHAGKRLVDGSDDKHRATGIASGSYTDTATGLVLGCTACHDMAQGPEHDRPNSSLAGKKVSACEGCHSDSELTASLVKQGWDNRTSPTACDNCHTPSGVSPVHDRVGIAHVGREFDETGTPVPGTCEGKGCHATLDLRVLHKTTGCTATECHQRVRNINGLNTRSCGGKDAATSCHIGYSATGGHSKGTGHSGVELSLNNKPTDGACAKPGCHIGLNLKTIHGPNGCALVGCHEPGLKPAKKSCGGTDAAASCHIGFTDAEHFVDHRADTAGTVNGVTYSGGANLGCTGCHSRDLMAEHTGTAASPITGGGASNCRVCHDDPRDSGNGAFAALSSVKAAVLARDRRCVACHASGTDQPSATAAATAHRKTTGADPLPAGSVWVDPLEQWRTALASPMGGGHNVDWTELGSVSKLFPLTDHTSGSGSYTWALPPNEGTTTWLKSEWVKGDPTSTSAIRHTKVTCGDCHEGTEAMTGPHGSAVRIAIDPAYSQTEYANPSRTADVSQFEAKGAQRVICMKCHTMSFGSVPGSPNPGGNPVHTQHAKHLGAPEHHPLRYGEKCIDCHVRIPHAWRSPRLLTRTVAGPDRPADSAPYVTEGFEGLAGVRLRSFERPTDLTRAACVTSGCHGHHDANDHPWPSDVPSSALWP